MATKSTKGHARKAKARDEGNRIAGNPQVSPAGISGFPKRHPAEVTGPHVSLASYFRGHRHWCAPLPDGTPRPLHRQFLELEREGIACLYDALNALVEESYPHGHDMRRPTAAPNLGRWGDMLREQAEVERAWAANNGTLVHRIDPRPANEPAPYVAPYGESYRRARYQLIHDVNVEHVVTEEEAARENEQQREEEPQWRAIIRPGDVYTTIDPQQSERATAEQVGHRWAEVYAEEVRHLLGDEPDDEHLSAFAQLHDELKGRAFDTKEGTRVMERMKAEIIGAEVLGAFQRIRDHLNALLDEVAEEHATPEQMENGHRITWQGTKGELAGLIMELHERGWIRRDGSWATLAAKVQAVFQDAQGQPFDLPTLRQYIKPSGNGRLREGVKFEISKRPE